jgi:hypothetical protein
VSSGNKEGLRARIEGVERVEAADEGLRGTRGMERESDVECIQSPSSWEASVDADSGRPSTFFPFTLAWTRPLPQSGSGRLCDKLPHHKTRPLEATARLVPSTYNAAQPSIMFFQPIPSSAGHETSGHCAVISRCHLYPSHWNAPFVWTRSATP